MAHCSAATPHAPSGTSSGPPDPDETQRQPGEQPGWLSAPEPPARGEARRDRTLLDLLPVGVLIYRLDRLLYANRAFLERMGYESLHALEEAGGLDALYVEPGVSNAASTSDTGTPVTISANGDIVRTMRRPRSTPACSRFHGTTNSALALIFSGARDASRGRRRRDSRSAAPPPQPSPVGHANAEELGAILDTTAEGIVMFDAEGNINSCNRSAEALFGYDGAELVQRNLDRAVRAGKPARGAGSIWKASRAPMSPACSITAAMCWAACPGAASFRCR